MGVGVRVGFRWCEGNQQNPEHGMVTPKDRGENRAMKKVTISTWEEKEENKGAG